MIMAKDMATKLPRVEIQTVAKSAPAAKDAMATRILLSVKSKSPKDRAGPGALPKSPARPQGAPKLFRLLANPEHILKIRRGEGPFPVPVGYPLNLLPAQCVGSACGHPPDREGPTHITRLEIAVPGSFLVFLIEDRWGLGLRVLVLNPGMGHGQDPKGKGRAQKGNN